MAQVGSSVTNKLYAALISPAGLPASVSEIGALSGVPLTAFVISQVTAQNVAPEISEKSTAVRYPSFNLYCAKVANLQREKFRTFSGEAQMVVEARVSQDKLEGIENTSQLYVDAITQVLDSSRGDWGDGVFYAGGYEVSYGPVKHGGRNFIQVAKINLTLEISKD